MTENMFLLGKIPRPAFWCKPKKHNFIAKFCYKFLAFSLFFQIFSTKIVEKAYFNKYIDWPYRHWFVRRISEKDVLRIAYCNKNLSFWFCKLEQNWCLTFYCICIPLSFGTTKLSDFFRSYKCMFHNTI